MSIKAKRRSGLVLFIVGLTIAVAAYLSVGGTIRGLEQNDIAFSTLFVGVPLALLGLVIMLLPKSVLESKQARIDHLEKRIAQLERNQKNTP
jgi:uncharacterized membrane protein YgaE (UPF0421/DUF939 family)